MISSLGCADCVCGLFVDLYVFTHEMGSRGRPSFDLNEPPTEEEDEKGSIPVILPQKSLPASNLRTPFLFRSTDGGPRLANNHAFTHASSGSGFQPFVGLKNLQASMDGLRPNGDDSNANEASTPLSASRFEDGKVSSAQASKGVDREEGELCDMNGDDDALPSDGRNMHDAASIEAEVKQRVAEGKKHVLIRTEIDNNSGAAGISKGNVGNADNVEKSEAILRSEGNGDLNSSSKGDASTDGIVEPPAVLKPQDMKGIEASHAVRIANSHSKKPKNDEHKEVMLGKKRARQTVFISAEDVKHAGSMKISTPKRPASFPSIVTRSIKETSRVSSAAAEQTAERPNHFMNKIQKQPSTKSEDQKAELNGDVNIGSRSRSRGTNGNESPSEGYSPSSSKEDLKQHSGSRQHKNPPSLLRKATMTSQSVADPKVANKKYLPPKKQSSNNIQYQDTSVERLHREVTSDKLWHHRGLPFVAESYLFLFSIY